MFLKAASSLGISELVISQLYWFLQDYQRNAFGVGAPTDVVEAIADQAPEDFVSIARRYARASPQTIRGLSGALREVSGVLAAVLAGKPDIGRIEARLGAPHVNGYVLAGKSPGWMATHG
jgi:NAD(P)H dehydrogenase (quinone)